MIIINKPPPRQKNNNKHKILSRGRYDKLKTEITDEIKIAITETITKNTQNTTTAQQFDNIQQSMKHYMHYM